MDLQFRLSNGSWMNCVGGYDGKQEDRTEEFLTACMKNNGPDESGKIVGRFMATRDLTRDEAVAALNSGKSLRNAPEDWYSECRVKPAPRPAPAPVELVKCSCGCSVPRGSVMSASMGTSCPDCYDRMSD